ncbi:hypothetical protein BDC45DRAFT_559477 [Circinella umbellata]|nr:hypothetical protein BDC45DRAFT_559477 [Circinella umbellata]
MTMKLLLSHHHKLHDFLKLKIFLLRSLGTMMMMIEADNSRRLLRGSPVCVFFLRLLWRFFYVCFCACNGNGMNSVCACDVVVALRVCALLKVWLAWCRHCGNLPFETGWQEGISVDGLIGIKGEKDELLYTPTSFLVSLGEQDEAYLEHQQIFCSRRFLFLNDNKTHLILYYFTKSVRKIIKVKTSCCHCFKLLFSSRKDLVKSSIMTHSLPFGINEVVAVDTRVRSK